MFGNCLHGWRSRKNCVWLLTEGAGGDVGGGDAEIDNYPEGLRGVGVCATPRADRFNGSILESRKR
ncbi:MAG: hypothetical protein ACLTZT_02485 [Butyricimonas faecalis]